MIIVLIMNDLILTCTANYSIINLLLNYPPSSSCLRSCSDLLKFQGRSHRCIDWRPKNNYTKTMQPLSYPLYLFLLQAKFQVLASTLRSLLVICSLAADIIFHVRSLCLLLICAQIQPVLVLCISARDAQSVYKVLSLKNYMWVPTYKFQYASVK